MLLLTRNTTASLAFYYIPVALLVPFLALAADHYGTNRAAYAVAVPVLVGVIHFLSLRRELRAS